MIDGLIPYLKIQAPDGKEERLSLIKTRYTIGRLPQCNDIVLPEEDGIITRIHHCVLAREVEGWQIIDQSTNGNMVKRQGQRLELSHQRGRMLPMASEDVIWIHHWRWQFIDPSQTKRVAVLRPQISPSKPWIFNTSQQTLFQVQNGDRQKVHVRPQVRKMLHHIASKNLANQGTAIVCLRGELIAAIWGPDDFGSHEQDLDRLAMEIRKIFGQTSSGEQWLETVVGAGYLLHIDTES
jgi:DNA-binding winged helix-turn-helix (wHTH) protein